ncbi:hypothetical protein FSP39_000065 [Pinctada imbricata]|uniref:VWFA domain-containing protein n=1 Tax=Pinctada imbricata TaxID=66713 RepID=A0AA88XKE8_PINIB|nr:hypothetical protein FSP39_000065 [Pinctada imbricata]
MKNIRREVDVVRDYLNQYTAGIARLEHYTAWNRFILEYRELVKRVQERYGVDKPSCGVELKELEAYMDLKKKYEAAFHQLSYGDKLLKEDLQEFFNDSGLYPTEGDITKAFNSVFKGNGYTAEVIFVLDCSTSTGPLSFYHLMNFVKDVVSSVEIAPNKVRVGVVPYSDDVFQTFGITDHHMKHEVHSAIDDIKFKEGLTRTDLALRKMKSYMMAARPGVQKLCIVITDGKSSEPQKTVHAAKEARADNIDIIAIGVGRRADLEELRAIASSDKHLLTACDYGALSSLKNVLAKKTCLGSIYNKTSNLKEQCRPLQKAEAMEVLWTAYPPSACKLKARSSRWIRPIVNGTEAWSLLDQSMVSSTDARTCLRLVIESRIEREGYVTLPSTVREGVEQVSNCDEALRIIENWIEYRKNHPEI